tara:strand:+ start:211 stop:363 length:153 start_codon:yes stop_codon:yes gene_type:complete
MKSEKRIYSGLIRTTDATHKAVRKIAEKNRWTLSMALEKIVEAYQRRAND